MNKAALLYLVVVSALVAFVIEVVTGFVLWLGFDRGDRRYMAGRFGEWPREEEFLGMDRWAWIDIHDWVGVALLVAIAVHLVLHWRWVVSMTRRAFVPASKESEAPGPAGG